MLVNIWRLTAAASHLFYYLRTHPKHHSAVDTEQKWGKETAAAPCEHISKRKVLMCRWIFANGVIWKSPSQLEMWNLCFPRSPGVILSDYAHPTHVQTIIITHWGNLRVFKHLASPLPCSAPGSEWRKVMGDKSPELVLHLTYELSRNISLMTRGSLAQREECPGLCSRVRRKYKYTHKK